MKKWGAALLVLGLVGCTAYRVPVDSKPGYSYTEAPIRELSIEASETAKYQVPYFERALLSTGIVNEVKYGTLNEETGLVVRFPDPYSLQCFSEPMLTVLTLGIIPHIGCSDTGYAFELHDYKSKRSVLVDSRKEVKSVFGWASLFYLPSENWVGEKGLAELESQNLAKQLNIAVKELGSSQSPPNQSLKSGTPQSGAP